MNWFHIEHKNGVALANIFGEIGVGQTAEEFVDELTDAQKVELRIDCPGGDSTAGIKVHDALLKRNTSATITGRCGSSGLIAIMGAKRIACISTARLLVHSPVNFVLGNACQFRASADDLDRTTARFEQIIYERTKQPLETVRRWVKAETYFSAEEALAAGLIDEIFTPPEVTDAIPTTAIEASDESSISAACEKEVMFKAWLSAFGTVPVADKAIFMRDLIAWGQMNSTVAGA